MKKLFALVLALCLLCGCTAMAETAMHWKGRIVGTVVNSLIGTAKKPGSLWGCRGG